MPRPTAPRWMATEKGACRKSMASLGALTPPLTVCGSPSVSISTLPLTGACDVNDVTFKSQADPAAHDVELSAGQMTWDSIAEGLGGLPLGNNATVTMVLRADKMTMCGTNRVNTQGQEALADMKIESDL